MPDKLLHELQSGNGFVNKSVVFVPVVVKCDRITVVTFLKESPILFCISFKRAVWKERRKSL